mmetsp:Transcript_93011/g.259132  ORF Transcript_93011/g.259132 Transcript_93011/m.259132 type:complete len:197 (+) Transcript_93011:81-671(+)
MSFADSLRRTSSKSSASIIALEKANIQNFVTEQVGQFKCVCAEEAERGRMQARHFVPLSRAELSKLHHPGICGAHQTEDSAKQAITQALKTSLDGMGFTSVTVQMKLTPADWGLEIAASWEGAPTKPQRGTRAVPSPRPSSGASLQCPVCFENAPAVCLVPCGHTVCGSCASRLLGGPCPSCRQPVNSLTQGVFMG